MNATELVNRHLPAVEFCALDVLSQFAHHKLLVQELGFGESRGVDGGEERELLFGVFDLLRNCFERIVAKAVVVAGVPDVGCELRIGAKRVLPLSLQGVAQLGAASVEAVAAILAGKDHGAGANNGCNDEQSHVENLGLEERG